jgi:molecular chaperone GrpE (heat shock protein)
MASIATNAWKAKSKMVDAKSGEALEEMKRVYRHIEAILESFQEMGLEIKDHTDDAFDYGLPLKVVTTQPTPGITKERVIETIKPTIYWQNRIIQMGEVVIATPA